MSLPEEHRQSLKDQLARDVGAAGAIELTVRARAVIVDQSRTYWSRAIPTLEA